MEGSIPFHRQHGVELGGPGVALGLVEMELREDVVSGTNLSFSFIVYFGCNYLIQESQMRLHKKTALLSLNSGFQVPKTCKNFIALCTGSPGYGYLRTTFHR